MNSSIVFPEDEIDDNEQNKRLLKNYQGVIDQRWQEMQSIFASMLADSENAYLNTLLLGMMQTGQNWHEQNVQDMEQYLHTQSVHAKTLDESRDNPTTIDAKPQTVIPRKEEHDE